MSSPNWVETSKRYGNVVLRLYLLKHLRLLPLNQSLLQLFLHLLQCQNLKLHLSEELLESLLFEERVLQPMDDRNEKSNLLQNEIFPWTSLALERRTLQNYVSVK